MQKNTVRINKTKSQNNYHKTKIRLKIIFASENVLLANTVSIHYQFY